MVQTLSESRAEIQALSRGNAVPVKRKSRARTDARKSSQGNLSDPALSALRDTWKSLPIIERGKRLTPFTEEYSQRELARLLNCSEARIRQLLDLAKLSPDAERDFCEGRIGVKRALKLVRESRAIDQRQRLISADPASRQELIERGASLIVRWILRLLPEVYALQFLGIVKGEEFGPVGEVFLKLTPKPCTIRLSANPARLIRRCKPKYAIPKFAPFIMNYCIVWWAAWGRRVMPDPEVRSAAVALAERRLHARIYEGRLAG